MSPISPGVVKIHDIAQASVAIVTPDFSFPTPRQRPKRRPVSRIRRPKVGDIGKDAGITLTFRSARVVKDTTGTTPPD